MRASASTNKISTGTESRLSIEDVKHLMVERHHVADRLALEWIEKSPEILCSTTQAQLFEWIQFSRKIFNFSTNGSSLCKAFLVSSEPFFIPDAFPVLKDWVASFLKIGKYSIDAAIVYLKSTPQYIKHRSVHGLQPWAMEIIDILKAGEESQKTAIAFIQTSPEIVGITNQKEYEDWKNLGLHMAKRSHNISSLYFSILPEGFKALGINGQRQLFKSVRLLAKQDIKTAVSFYQDHPGILLKLNPNARDKFMDILFTIAGNDSARFRKIYHDVVSIFTSLSYPDQEQAAELADAIVQCSINACLAFLKNVLFLMDEVPNGFISNWVEKGLSVIRTDTEKGISYFSLSGNESISALEKWKSAIDFDEVQSILSVYAKAICGENLSLQKIDSTGPHGKFPLWHRPENLQAIYLPGYLAEGQTRRQNFMVYKAAASHQACRIEFGTYDSNYKKIRTYLRQLPITSLAEDIFFILEDGRIHCQLKKKYRGLRPEIEEVLAIAMGKRRISQSNPLLALIEVLLRLSVDCLKEKDIPHEIREEAYLLKKALNGFYERAYSNWDAYEKTIEIYEYLSPLAKRFVYSPIPPLPHHVDMDAPLIPGHSRESQDGSSLKKIKPPGSDKGSTDEKDDLKSAVKDAISSKGIPLTELSNVPTEEVITIVEPEEEKVKFHPPSATTYYQRFQQGLFYYDEWDYLQGSYRKRWCSLYEKSIASGEGEYYQTISDEYSDIIKKVKKQFQRIRPIRLEPVRRVEWGDEIDLDEMIHRVVDRKLGLSPSEKIFSRKEKINKKMSILLLIDMSASTSDVIRKAQIVANGTQNKNKRIIDLLKESLVVVMEAFEILGNPYAVYGFSGQGRHQVDLYTIKDFAESNSEEIKCRIGAIEPKQSTRMGCAIRHSLGKLRQMEADIRLLVLLSDGFPQDLDYGEDRKSKRYALHDTMMAFAEVKKEGIHPFCITVDHTGNDHLKKLSDPKSYLLIEDIYSLPLVLPRIVESLLV